MVGWVEERGGCSVCLHVVCMLPSRVCKVLLKDLVRYGEPGSSLTSLIRQYSHSFKTRSVARQWYISAQASSSPE